MICCSMVLRCVIFLSPFYFFIFLFGFPLLERKNHWFLWSPLKIFHHLYFEICSWRFVFWRFVQKIFHFLEDVFMEICPFENLFKRFFLLKICSGDFSFHEDIFRRFSFYEDVFMEICPLKICLGDFPFEDLFRRLFLSWRYIQEIFLFMKMNSWRFVLWKLKCRRFIHCWRFDHGDLSFEDLFRRFFLLWRCVHEDLSIEDWSVGDLSLFEDFSFLKTVLGDLSFWNFFRRFVLLKICLGDLSFEKFSRRFVLWKLKFRRFFLF